MKHLTLLLLAFIITSFIAFFYINNQEHGNIEKTFWNMQKSNLSVEKNRISSILQKGIQDALIQTDDLSNALEIYKEYESIHFIFKEKIQSAIYANGKSEVKEYKDKKKLDELEMKYQPNSGSARISFKEIDGVNKILFRVQSTKVKDATVILVADASKLLGKQDLSIEMPNGRLYNLKTNKITSVEKADLKNKQNILKITLTIPELLPKKTDVEQNFYLVTQVSQSLLDDQINNMNLNVKKLFLPILVLAFIAIYLSLVAIKKTKLANHWETEGKYQSELAKRAKEEFIGNITHEFRTPMNAIVGMSDLLIGSDLNKEQKEYAKSVSISSNKLLTQVNNILDYSRIISSQIVIETTPMSLTECIDNCIETYSAEAAEKFIAITFVNKNNTRNYIRSDNARLHQIIGCLIDNAVKFTEFGGIEIKLLVEKTSANYADFIISVQDTGIGIAPEKYKRIFKPFTQADLTKKREHSGAGLGLAIVNALTFLLDGEIFVDSSVGTGTKCTIKINAELEDDPLEKYNDTTILHDKRVLIINKNSNSSRIMTRMLLRLGVYSETVGKVKSAIGMLNQPKIHFDLVLIQEDIIGEKAINIVSELRYDKAARFVPIIVASANANEVKASLQDFSDIHSMLTPIREKELFLTMCDLIENKGKNIKDDKKQTYDLNVLVADDNKINVKLLSAYLKKQGIIVHVANDGEECVEKAKNTKYDLIFMDIHMPKLDGIEATEAIREIYSEDEVEIVATTTDVYPEDRVKFFKAGMTDFTPKPVTQKEIIRLLEKVVNKKA